MAGIDDLLAQIPTHDIANRVGADEGEVHRAIQTLVPALVGGLQHNAEDPDHAAQIESAAGDHAGLLDAGATVDQVDQAGGETAIAKIFGGNDTAEVASALSGGGAGDNDLFGQLLPILTPIVLAYIGKQMSGKDAPARQQGSGGVLGDVLGSILGGGAGGKKSTGNVLGNILGGKAGRAIGDVLGGLLGGKK